MTKYTLNYLGHQYVAEMVHDMIMVSRDNVLNIIVRRGPEDSIVVSRDTCVIDKSTGLQDRKFITIFRSRNTNFDRVDGNEKLIAKIVKLCSI